MHIDFQVEEPSMEQFLIGFAPKLLGATITFNVINYGNKQNMLNKLPSRLRAYRKQMANSDVRLVFLLDKDNDDCHVLKQRLEGYARDAGIATKSAPSRNHSFTAVTRIVVHELEAWYFGDIAALRQVYPRIPQTLQTGQRYRDSDAIPNTWEALHRLLVKHNYLSPKSHLPKLSIAQAIASHISIENNTSASFSHFVSGTRALLQSPL